jgi:hypothetical protein
VDKALVELSAVDREKILSFMESAEFENLCFDVAIAGCMPENPVAHMAVLKKTLELSLRRYAGVRDERTKLITDALFQEIVAISWREVNRHQKEGGVAKRSLTPEIISSHIASSARNAEIHRKLANLSEVDQFSAHLSQQCARVHGKIRPAQTESGARVPFERLYVQSHLTIGDKGSDIQDFADARELLRQVTRLVVLGDPGGGKTTLAMKFTLDIARGLGTGPALQAPLRVVLREYASQYKSNQESVIGFLEKQCKADYSAPAPEGAIEYLLLNGRAVVIFDGLDELTDTSLRTAIVGVVEAFTHAYPTAPILVTSRRVGYEMAPLDESLFTVTHLSPFSMTQQRQYVQRWFSHVRGSAGEGDMAARFIAESSHARDLTSNPLMLGLMCALYRGEGYIPRNRPDLYRRCSEFLFERWDASRGIAIAKPFERNIQFAMFSLALSMLRSLSEGGGMTERELTRYTSDYLLGQHYEDRDTADAAAEAFVRYCRGRAWVLTDVGTNPDGERIYSFTHRTFLEYFSARQLVRDSGDVDSLYQELREHLMNESWDVTAQLAVQFLDERLGDAGNDFVRLALADAQTAPDYKKRAALVSFCARLLEFMTLRPSTVRDVVSVLCQLMVEAEVSKPASIRRQYDVLSSAWSGVSICASETREVANDELLKSLSSSAKPTYDGLRMTVSMADFVPRHASDETREFWAEKSKENARQVPLLELTREDPRAAAAAVLFGLLEASQAVLWHGGAVMTCQDIFPVISIRRRSHNVLSELAYPRSRWGNGENEIIAGEVVEALLSTPTPWMEGRQTFLTYSSSLAQGANENACRLLHWMLGREMREGVEESGGEERQSDVGLHHLFSSVAEARRRGAEYVAVRKYRDMFSPEFLEFISKWCKREISLSRGDAPQNQD